MSSNTTHHQGAGSNAHQDAGNNTHHQVAGSNTHQQGSEGIGSGYFYYPCIHHEDERSGYLNATCNKNERLPDNRMNRNNGWTLVKNTACHRCSALHCNPVEEKVLVNGVLKDVDYCQNPCTGLNQHIISHKDAKATP